MKDESPQKPQIILEQNARDRQNEYDCIDRAIYYHYEGGSKWVEQAIYEEAYYQAHLKRKRAIRAYIRKRYFKRLMRKILGLFAK